MKKWFLLLLTSLLLLGCSNIDREEPGRPRVVTRIQASYDSSTMSLRRDYTDAEKMQAVLTYLRCLGPYGSAAPDTETAADPRVHIRLHYSDNTVKDYVQLSDQYLQIDGGAWQQIPVDRAQEFPVLLGLMESDGD